jgi:uncharacterized membrane protein YkgB
MVKLGIKNFLMIGLMAVLFIVFAKVIFTKYEVKGVSQLVQAV